MSQVWNHPEIGEFKRGIGEWTTKLDPLWPGKFDQFEAAYTPSTDQLSIEIAMGAPEDEPCPAPDAVDQLERFWSIRDRFANDALEYLWSLLKGQEQSRIWWCGVSEDDWKEATSGEAPMPTSASEVGRCLWNPGVSVRYIPEETGEVMTVNPFTGEPLDKPTKAYPPHPAYWTIECAFGCVWEQEHCIAVYWRNGRFIGADMGDGQGQPPDDYMPD